MYKFLFMICIFIFFACSSDDKNINSKQEVIEEVIQIEQSDAKVQVNDSNVPLPVDEKIDTPSIFENCLSCHKQSDLTNLNKEVFLSKMNEFQKNKKSKEHILEDNSLKIITEYLYQGK